MHKSRHMHDRQKLLDPFGISLLKHLMHQVINLALQVLPGEWLESWKNKERIFIIKIYENRKLNIIVFINHFCSDINYGIKKKYF